MDRVLLRAVCFFVCLAAGISADAAPGDKEKTDAEIVEDQPVAANPSIFSGGEFPKIDFVNNDLMQRAFGSYTLKIRYFDAGWNEVDHPGAPGRYGAFIDIHFKNGISETRHLTLFKTAQEYSLARDSYQASFQFPADFGLPSGLGQTEAWNFGKYIDDTLGRARTREYSAGAFVAAMADIAADPARLHGFEYWTVDSFWWDEMDKRLGLQKPYRKLVRLPEGYDKDPAKKWPLIVFLHGSGERGDDLAVLKGQGPAAYAEGGHPLPFIVATPQCPKQHNWNPELVLQLVGQMEKDYRVDPSRIYLTGLSLGGFGVLDAAALHPDKFAAVACLSGREDVDLAPRLQHVPIWFFHGTEDDVVPTRYVTELVDALKKEGAPVKLTLIPHTGHGDWDKVYARPELYAWFLQNHL